jgi:hypothetical protein
VAQSFFLWQDKLVERLVTGPPSIGSIVCDKTLFAGLSSERGNPPVARTDLANVTETKGLFEGMDGSSV